jgi:hypothetical protein
MRLLVLLGSLGLWLIGSSALAQGNDLLAPTGGRSALMGNTGVSLARDGSAPFYNPATIVRIRDERLAFSVNFYSLGLTYFSDWHQPGEVDQDRFGDRNLGGTGLLESAFRALPTSLCLFFTLEDLAEISTLGEGKSGEEEVPGKKLAICFASLESEDVDLQAIGFQGETEAGITTQAQSIQRRWNRIYVGPTYSLYLNDQLAIGGSVQVVYSYQSFGLNSSSLSVGSDGSSIASTLGTSGSGRSFELTAVLGATYRFDNVTLGASVRVPSLHVMGKYDGTFNRSDTVDQNETVVADGTGTMYSAPPTRLGLGVGFAWDRLTLELNTALSLPIQHALRASVDVNTNTIEADRVSVERSHEDYEIPSHTTVNPSVGFEYFLSSGLSLLGGFAANFTALSPLAPVNSIGNIIQARMSHLTASFGLGSYWEGGELLFGIQLDYGWGQSLAVNPYVLPNDWSIVDTRNYALTFVISGATSLKSIVRMVKTIADGSEGEIKNPEQDPMGTSPGAEPEGQREESESDTDPTPATPASTEATEEREAEPPPEPAPDQGRPPAPSEPPQ